MIISRAPFRVSFCGGGSDIASFYSKYGGCVLSTTIKKYVFLALHKAFNPNNIILKYSKTEVVSKPQDIEHKIFREVLNSFDLNGVEITSMADIPAGTGLGSSSAFTVALLRLIYAYKGLSVSAYKVAKEACEVEIEKLGSPIGKQDQFASSFGGLRFYEFCPDGFVKIEPIIMRKESYQVLQESCLVFYTGDTRSANGILAAETKNLASEDDKIAGTKRLCDLTRSLKTSFENNDIYALGDVLKESWKIKKTLAKGISNPKIDEMYERAIRAGARSGKLLGAGGGGFLLLFVPGEEERANVRAAFKGFQELPFELDQAGCSIIFYD